MKRERKQVAIREGGPVNPGFFIVYARSGATALRGTFASKEAATNEVRDYNKRKTRDYDLELVHTMI